MRLLLPAMLAFSLAAADLPPTANGRAPAAVPTWQETVDTVQREIADLRHATEGSRSWTRHGMLAAEYLHLAGLTGDPRWYIEAEQTLTAAFALAPAGSGPLQVRAQWQATQHRFALALADAEKLSQRIVLSQANKERIEALVASCAFAAGKYDEAENRFRALALRQDRAQAWFDLANVLRCVGKIEEAETALTNALGRCPPDDHHLRAWLHLQHGLTAWELGDPATADQWYAQAETFFPGWWLVREHRAEARAALGHTDESISTYLELIAETQDPAFMHAISQLYAETGDVDAAARWWQQATDTWRQRIALLPDAMTGHALDHFLDDAHPELYAEGLALAEHNLTLRQDGEAWIGLARAQRLTGDVAQARSSIETLLDTSWVTLSLFEEAEEIYRASGEPEQAQAMQARAAELTASARSRTTVSP